ncbi:hypothetical protein KPSA3_02134 [Pseudomonas syringae pv. actinidiae]|uniref:Uncharacterized protein n=1 Tax=Pseudomonas syringae pv. actinidiae TaxID=103796 RepID=A0AAN4Q2F8_PSESF|nr:hypothetical protein KPSA3_02134 [Pseudomonas syringae pv. actinidiae]
MSVFEKNCWENFSAIYNFNSADCLGLMLSRLKTTTVFSKAIMKAVKNSILLICG